MAECDRSSSVILRRQCFIKTKRPLFPYCNCNAGCGSHLSLPFNRCQSYFKRAFFPQEVDFLFRPIFALLIQHEVEIPNESRKNQSHFSIGQTNRSERLNQCTGGYASSVHLLATNTVPWASAKWLKSVSIIRLKSLICTEESFGNETVGIVEIVW
jgi:hypothetical protein